MGGGSSCDGKRASEERPGKTDPINMLEELQAICSTCLFLSDQTYMSLGWCCMYTIMSTFNGSQ